jgi:hypothetical protein
MAMVAIARDLYVAHKFFQASGHVLHLNAPDYGPYLTHMISTNCLQLLYHAATFIRQWPQFLNLRFQSDIPRNLVVVAVLNAPEPPKALFGPDMMRMVCKFF